jgi:hypothetical protein
MPDYSNSKIYKLECYTTGLIYIGSTTQFLIQRLQGHKKNYKTYLNGNGNFVTSFKILENDNYNIVLLEEYPCDNKEQLHAKEAEYIKKTDCVNKYIPNRTYKEWCDDNKDKLTEYQKEYYSNNKDKMAEQCKQYYSTNKDKMAEQQKQYREHNKDRIAEQRKQYYSTNKDKMAEQRKQYYSTNKDKIAEQCKQYYSTNKDRIAEYKKQYANKNKDRIAEYQKQYREQKKHDDYADALTT